MSTHTSLKRSTFLSTCAVVAGASLLVGGRAQEISQVASSTNGKPSIVFCHGIWADGSCFSKVIEPLQAAGYECISAQYPLNTTADDIAIVKKTLSRVSSPSILVGHSYGGQVITGAGTDDRVRGLVYICALGPDEGETAQGQLGMFPTTPVFEHVEVADGRIWMKPAGIADFCGDLPEAEQKVVWATSYPPAADLFSAPMSTPAWKTKPSWYIVGKNDKAVPPDLERFVSKRMGAHTIELDSSHCAMLSQAQAVVDMIEKAANAVLGKAAV
jgi:pimeloyl-ACP methyl ester carboxylesterase